MSAFITSPALEVGLGVYGAYYDFIVAGLIGTDVAG